MLFYRLSPNLRLVFRCISLAQLSRIRILKTEKGIADGGKNQRKASVGGVLLLVGGRRWDQGKGGTAEARRGRKRRQKREHDDLEKGCSHRRGVTEFKACVWGSAPGEKGLQGLGVFFATTCLFGTSLQLQNMSPAFLTRSTEIS